MVLRLGILLLINKVRLFRKKFQFVLTCVEFGFVSKYVVVSCFMSSLSLSQFADLYWNTLCGGLLLRIGFRFTLKVTAS